MVICKLRSSIWFCDTFITIFYQFVLGVNYPVVIGLGKILLESLLDDAQFADGYVSLLELTLLHLAGNDGLDEVRIALGRPVLDGPRGSFSAVAEHKDYLGLGL